MIFLELLKMPHKRAQFKLKSMLTANIEFQYYAFASESGLFKALSEPLGKDELIQKMAIVNQDLFELALTLGLRLKMIVLKNDQYHLKSPLAKAMATPSGGPIASMVKEMKQYHGSVFGHLSQALREKERKDYLRQYGPIVAESSRIIEPFIRLFIQTLLTEKEKHHILEMGCGSGEYLKYYHQINPRNTGIGIDIDQAVVEQATKTLAGSAHRENFKIICGDIRDINNLTADQFSLITAYQNIYYFTGDERRKLFSNLRSRLTEGGKFTILSVFPSKTAMSPYFDIILSSTRGCYPLPARETVLEELRAAGFSDLKEKRLIPGEELWGIIAR